MMPELSLKDENRLPAYSMDLGDGYVLLTARDNVKRKVSDKEANAILGLWESNGWPNLHGWTKEVKRWARLRIPNGQVARSVWGESRSRKKLRRTTIVKVSHSLAYYTFACSNSESFKFSHNGAVQFGEVQYYFSLAFGDHTHPICVLSVFSDPDQQLLKDSHHAIYACHYLGEENLLAIDVKQIKTVVAMIPYYKVTAQGEIEIPPTEHFLVEKPHLELTFFRPLEDPDSEGEE